jgi:hypothetical protein
VGSEGVELLSSHLLPSAEASPHSSPTVTALDLSRCKATTLLSGEGDARDARDLRGVEALAAMLRVNETLTSLNLWGNGLEDEGILIVLRGLLGERAGLLSLDVAYNRLSTAGAAEVAELLGSNTGMRLRSLRIGSGTLPLHKLRGGHKMVSLRGLELGPLGATIVSRLLSNNDALAGLDVSDNMLRKEGIMTICDSLARGCGDGGDGGDGSLTMLDVSSNEIFPDGARWISDLIEAQPTLAKVRGMGVERGLSAGGGAEWSNMGLPFAVVGGCGCGGCGGGGCLLFCVK